MSEKQKRRPQHSMSVVKRCSCGTCKCRNGDKCETLGCKCCDAAHDSHGLRDRVITLCGSTRFYSDFEEAGFKLGCKGFLVFSLAINTRSDEQLIKAGLFPSEPNELKGLLMTLADAHFRKISMSEGIMVIDVGGYVGESTQREINYAVRNYKKIYSYEFTKLLNRFDKPVEVPKCRVCGKFIFGTAGVMGSTVDGSYAHGDCSEKSNPDGSRTLAAAEFE